MRQPLNNSRSSSLLLRLWCCCCVILQCQTDATRTRTATRTVRGRNLHKSAPSDIFTDTAINQQQLGEPVPEDGGQPIPEGEGPPIPEQLPEDEVARPAKGKAVFVSKGKGFIVSKGKGDVVPEGESTEAPLDEGQYPSKGGIAIFKGGGKSGGNAGGKSGARSSGKSGARSSGKSGGKSKGASGVGGKGFDFDHIFVPIEDAETDEPAKGKGLYYTKGKGVEPVTVQPGKGKGYQEISFGSMKKSKSKWAYHKTKYYHKPNPQASTIPTISPVPTRAPSPTISPFPTADGTAEPPTIPAPLPPPAPGAPIAMPIDPPVGPPLTTMPIDTPATEPTTSPSISGNLPPELPTELPTVDLTPYTLLYELPVPSEEDVQIPSEEDVQQVAILTANYLRSYFVENVAGLEGFVNYWIDDRFNFGEPYRIDYNATAIFFSDSVLPEASTLDAVLASAFQEPGLSLYLSTVNMLPPENPFSGTTSVALGETPDLFVLNTPNDGTSNESTILSNIKLGVSAGSAVAAFAGIVAGVFLCRRRKQHYVYSGNSKDYPVNDTPTIAGETCEETTIEFEYPNRTTSEKAQSEFGLSTHFEEEGSTGLSDGDSNENMFDTTDEMENMALFQHSGEAAAAALNAADAADSRAQSKARKVEKAAVERRRTPTVPTPTSSTPEEYEEYELDDAALESSKPEEEKLVSSSGLFSGAFVGDAVVPEDTFLITDTDSEEEDEVPVRVVDMIQRFG